MQAARIYYIEIPAPDIEKADKFYHSILYIKVENINETLNVIKAQGGEVLLSKEEIGGGYGFSATFKDPNGNHLGLWCEN
ncbi:MAG: hypothetical protein HON90_05140 [Halobacteriovoraceae bacterium]|jgi:predicted enzyme related to lactoylglutathione lyase|nr:hypothetical protein [Halobacteriovoraceae bacterium]